MHFAQACFLLLCALASCGPVDVLPNANPFGDESAVPMDGEPHELSTTIAPLGELSEGEVIRLQVSGARLESVLILIADPLSADAGVIVGGGEPNAFFDYRVQIAGRYFVYVQFETTSESGRASLTVMPGDANFSPPDRQVIRVEFETNFLTNPGLTDPDSFTQDERQLLSDIEPLVRDQVLTEIRGAFAGTPIEIIDQSQPLPNGPFSVLTFTPQRMPVEPGVSFDAAIPAVDPSSPCLVPVVFGEVLPRGKLVDYGNQDPADTAVVYVGSFQGRGFECRSAVLASLNNIVLALAHTAEHEIGHLVGLNHVTVVDIMDRRPTAAFQRDLGFARGQLLIEIAIPRAGGGTDIETRVLTNIFQDPAMYFKSIFAQFE